MERNNFFARFTSRAPAAGPVEFLVVGLGNPGREYENTRHNAGFLAADRIAEKHHASIDRLKFKGTVGQCRLGGKGVLLLKPGTYMNLSGQSVTEAMRFYKLKPEQVLVIFDDINLEPGQLRIRRKGSDGGHNGMKNIIYLSGSDQFPRIKLGGGQKAPSQLRPCGLGALPLYREGAGGPLHRPGQRRRRGGAHREGRHRPGHEPVQQLRRDAMKLIGNMLRRWPEYQTLAAAVKQGALPAAAAGLSGIHKCCVLAALCQETGRKALVLAADEAEAQRFSEDLFALGMRPALYPIRDFSFRDTAGVSHEYERLRLEALSQLQNGSCNVVIACMDAALQYTLSPPGALRPDVPGGGGPGAED